MTTSTESVAEVVTQSASASELSNVIGNTGHAYNHLVGTTIGVRIDGTVVAAHVHPAELGQDHNLMLVTFDDGTWDYVRAMDRLPASWIR